MSSRREFIKTVTAAVTGSKLVQVAMAADQRAFAGPFGVQLYSLREQLQRDVPGSLTISARSGTPRWKRRAFTA